ncbi:mucin-binding protein [Fructilactobacillus fructivorans]|uniref:mucin-binding protein n=1 Tax=Fructilactobacillus fructivorans TaxID=1614 RepID=UPI0006F02968|nr:MucBP domain-containing protein [Fructilactobacillus fructivorans]KRK58126.1 cell surface protein precursor [Fructilactobacillus fructivorans]
MYVDSKKHFKMYKAGKKWMVAAIVTAFTVGGLTIGVNADTMVSSNSSSDVSTSEQSQQTTYTASTKNANAENDQSHSVTSSGDFNQTTKRDTSKPGDQSPGAKSQNQDDDQSNQPVSKSQPDQKQSNDQSSQTKAGQDKTVGQKNDSVKDENNTNSSNHQSNQEDKQSSDQNDSSKVNPNQKQGQVPQTNQSNSDDKTASQNDQPKRKTQDKSVKSDPQSATNQPVSGQKNNNTQLASENTNSNLPRGIKITSNQVSAPSNNDFNQFGNLDISNNVSVTDANATINPGDKIGFNIAHSADSNGNGMMKKVINWNRVAMTGGTDYGHLEVNGDTGQVFYVFDKTVQLTTSGFEFNLNVPFQADSSVPRVATNYSSDFQQGNTTYQLGNFSYGYTVSSNLSAPNQAQAPGLRAGQDGSGDYAGVSTYDGPNANNPVAGSDHAHSIFDPSKGDQPSFTNVLYPNTDPDSNLNNLTGRTWTVDVKGNKASFDLNGLRFGIPQANLPSSVAWAGKYAGQWITLGQLRQVLPGMQVQMNQISSDNARLALIFPNDVGIQDLQFTGNLVAPDVGGTYSVNFGYHDDQGTHFDNIPMTLTYRTSKQHGFFPSIAASDKSLNADTFDVNNLNRYLLDGTNVQDSTNNDKLKISDDSYLRNALIEHQAGTYNVTYETTNSLGLTSYQTVSVTVAVSQNVTDSTTGTTTIHYNNNNCNQVAPDKVINAHFTRTGKRDPLTNNVTWDDWDSDDSGYDITPPTVKFMTPNKIHVSGDVVANEHNFETVVYSGMTKLVTDEGRGQRKIYYVDRNGKEIAPSKTVTADFTRTGLKDLLLNEIMWNNWTSNDNHYDVSLPAIDGMASGKDGVSGTITLNENDTDNVIYTDNTEPVSDHATAQRTIHYVDSNGNEIAPSKIVTANFIRTGTKNLRTDDIAWNNWTSNNDRYDINSATVDNMTPGQQRISGVLTPGERNSENVIYSDNTKQITDETTGQKVIRYVDRDGKKVAPSKTMTADFTRTGIKDLRTGDVTWNKWNSNHYNATSPSVDNMTPSQSQISGTLSPNENDSENVVYTDNTEPVNDQTTGRKTIHYVDHDGKKVASSKTITTNFHRTGIKDMRSGNITWNNWIDNDNHYNVTSPAVDNMTPNEQHVCGTIALNENDSEKVVYTDNTKQITNKVGGQKVIRYVNGNGKEVVPSKTVTANFIRTGTKDLRTNNITWNDWNSENARYDVTSPAVDSMTPDKKRISGTLMPNESSSENVIYTKNHSKETKTTLAHPANGDSSDPIPSQNNHHDNFTPNKNKNNHSMNFGGKKQSPIASKFDKSNEGFVNKITELHTPRIVHPDQIRQQKRVSQVPLKVTTQSNREEKTAKPNQVIRKNKAQLPQTGQNSDNFLSIIGTMLLSLLGFIGLEKWFRDRKETK